MPSPAAPAEPSCPPTPCLDLLPDWVWEADAHGICTYSNTRVREVLGLHPEEVVGRPLPDGLLTPWQNADCAEICTAHWNPAGGQQVTLETRVSPVRDEQGAVRGWTGVSRDITQRQQDEEGARQRLALFQNIARQAGTVLYERDIDAPAWSFMSEGIERLSGYRAEEFCPPLWREILQETVPRGELAGLPPAEAMRRFQAGDVSEWRADYRIRTRSGEERWFADVSIPLRGGGGGSSGTDGKVTGSLGILEDVTERMHSAEKLQRIMTGARCMLWYASIREVNGVFHWDLEIPELTAARRWLPVPAEEGERYEASLYRAKHPEDRVRTDRNSRNALRGGQPGYSQEFRCFLADGSLRWLHEDVQIEPVDAGSWRAVGVITDVTEQRRAQEALRDSEARFRSAFDDAAIGMALVAPDGRFLEVNAAFCGFVGYSEEEMLRRQVTEVTHPDDHAASQEVIRRALQGEFASFRMEKRYLHKRGHSVWGEMNASVVRDEAGNPRYTVAQVQDITDRKQAEEERRYILTGARCLLWYAEITEDESGALQWRITVPDEEAARRFLPLVVEPGRTYADTLHLQRHPEDLERTNAHGVSRVRAGQDYSQEYRCRAADGEWHRLQEQVHVETVTAGQRWRAVGVVTDVTETRRAEEEIERRTAALEHAVEGIAYLDARGRYRLVNPAYASICGYEPSRMRGLPWKETVHPDERGKMEKAHEEMRRNGKAEIATIGVRRDGTGFQTQMTLVAAHDEEGRFIGHYCFMKDVTDRRRMEAQMLQTEKLAALGELVAGVAHEINNPLAAISGTAQLLQMHPDAQVKTDAATIYAMTQRAERIVRALRNFSRAAAGDEKAPADLNRAVEAVLDMVSYPLKKSEISLEVSLDTSLPPLWMNDNQIQQVLLNLINNADHALRKTPSERRFLRVATARREDENGAPWAELSVCDTGCGIDAAALGRIFDPFFTTKDIGEGTGLGLSICHGIVEAHGGKISVHSRKGEGTLFAVRLPLPA